MEAGKLSESDNDAHTPQTGPEGGNGFVIMEKTDKGKRLKVLLVNGSPAAGTRSPHFRK